MIYRFNPHTVVGEPAATVPEDVGVFSVEDGAVTEQEAVPGDEPENDPYV